MGFWKLVRSRNWIASLLAVWVSSFLFCAARAETVADWTFETSQPSATGASITGIAPEIGSGTASVRHADSSTVFSSPTGNGSANSFEANDWAVGDYFQFEVSTVGFTDVSISFDQVSSSTGPGTFYIAYSTDDVHFNGIGSGGATVDYAVANKSWSSGSSNSTTSYSDNLDFATALDNSVTAYFRLVDDSSTSADGGTVASGGTDRIDNFTVTATPAPEPSALVLTVAGSWLLLTRRRKQR
jgi:hypothetical protein